MEKLALANMGAGCLVIENKMVLLVKLNYGLAKGKWILPGGMVETGEAPHIAALRELKEETGLDGEVISQLSVRHRIDDKGHTNIYWVFNCKNISPKNTKLTWPDEELQDVKFWDLDEALTTTEVRPMTQLFIDLALGQEKEKIIKKLTPSRTDTVYW